MSSFSERHAPAPRPLGDEIPPGVRRAIESWFDGEAISPGRALTKWFQRFGYDDVEDVIGDVRDRWGEDRANGLRADLKADSAVARWHDGDRQRAVATSIVHHYVPAALFLDFVEASIEIYGQDHLMAAVDYMSQEIDPYGGPVAHLNQLFSLRGISYRVNDRGCVEWHGDAGAYVAVIRPALDTLGDTRLTGARQEFEAALVHLRQGTAKDREDAIEEAGKSVESGMQVVLSARGVTRQGNEAAERLWNLLRDNDLVPPKTKDAILSTARLRNEYGGHGQGEEVREIPPGIPELSVQAAAAAIGYLASRLP